MLLGILVVTVPVVVTPAVVVLGSVSVKVPLLATLTTTEPDPLTIAVPFQ